MENIQNLTHESRPPFTDNYSPVACYKLNVIALIYTVLFLSSVVVNTLIIYAFYHSKEAKNPLQWLIIGHTGLNLFASIVELPIVITANLLCWWPFGKNGCTFTGFIMYFVGKPFFKYRVIFFSWNILNFDIFFNFNLFSPVTYYFVEKNKGILSMDVFYSLGLYWACSTILKKEVFW